MDFRLFSLPFDGSINRHIECPLTVCQSKPQAAQALLKKTVKTKRFSEAMSFSGPDLLYC